MNILEHKSVSVFLVFVEDKFPEADFQSYTAFWEAAEAFQEGAIQYIDLSFFF